jgi:hypothetical protein
LRNPRFILICGIRFRNLHSGSAFYPNPVNKDKLLTIDNPNYEAIIARYSHLSGVKIIDNGKKASLPVHVVLNGGEYARIKTETKPQVGKEGEPVAEYTKLGWFIMSPGEEFDRSTTRNSVV